MRSNYKKKLFQRVEKIKSSRFSKEKSSFLNIFINLVNLFFVCVFFLPICSRQGCFVVDITWPKIFNFIDSRRNSVCSRVNILKIEISGCSLQELFVSFSFRKEKAIYQREKRNLFAW